MMNLEEYKKKLRIINNEYKECVGAKNTLSAKIYQNNQDNIQMQRQVDALEIEAANLQGQAKVTEEIIKDLEKENTTNGNIGQLDISSNDSVGQETPECSS